METIDIALASDHGYFCGLLVTAVSMARFASREAVLRFDVLDGGVKDEAWQFLCDKLRAEHPHVVVRRFKVDDGQFSAFPEWNGPSRMTYARLLLPELVTDATYILYCDVDFLWTADVAELWALRDDKICIQAHLDWPDSRYRVEPPWFKARKLPFESERYICAGLLLMNLVRFRQENMSARMMDFLRCHPDVQYVDQTAINAVLMQSEDLSLLKLLPDKWHRFSGTLRPEEINGAWAIHYGGNSPWRRDWWTQLLNDATIRWHGLYGELTGRTVWQSLRQFYSAQDIVLRRLIFRLVRWSGTRCLFFVFLRTMGRGCYISTLKRQMGLS